MSPTMKELGIDRLSPAQRVSLALEIWESLGEDRPRRPTTSKQREELARRDADLTAHPEIALSWEQIRASIKASQ